MARRVSFGERLVDWLVPPVVAPEDAAAFAEHARELTARFWPGIGVLLSLGALVWWPIDQFVYPESPATREAFSEFRLRIIVLDLTLAVVLPRVRLARRHAHLVVTLAALGNLWLAGWLLAEAGQGDARWFYYLFMTPVFSVLLLVPLRARVLVASSFTAAATLAWLAHPVTRWDAEGAAAGFSNLVFGTALGIFIGHILFVQVQRSFHLGRRVEQQRVGLELLASRLEERVATQTETIRELSARAQEIRAEQRLEIARELHDGLGQELTSMRLLVDVGLRTHRGEGAAESFAELAEQLRQIQKSLRRVLVSLSPQPLEESSLPEALAILTGELERRSGIECRFLRRDVPPMLPSAMNLALFRIAQEGLTNAIRHARARRIELVLERRDDAIVLEVRDGGQGIAVDAVGAGFGTRGIRERAEALGGRAVWTGGAGTTLTVTLPLTGSR